MDNKAMFKLAGEITTSLVKTKQLNNPKDAKDVIFRSLQATKTLVPAISEKEKEKEREFELANKLATDKTFARGWLIQELAGQTKGNNASAAKELRDLLRIDSAEETTITVTNYKDAHIYCPQCSGNVHKPAELG